MALTDINGAVKARYEYDEWGRLQAMYDETGRVREGYGTIGDSGTGLTRPATGKPGPGSNKKGSATSTLSEPPATEPVGTEEEQGELMIQGVVGEPTDLVKMNPYRYAGYRYDRDTQDYFLQQRYMDTRLGRFLSQDTWAGDDRTPLLLPWRETVRR